MQAGCDAGTVSQRSGYLMVGISRRYYLAHRLIWKWVTGEEPLLFIDHIDGAKLNNRWVNFRVATNKANLWNSKLRKDNSSGFKGVSFRPLQSKRPWTATLALGGGKYRRVGSFATPEEAAAAWQQAAREQRGEFFRAA